MSGGIIVWGIYVRIGAVGAGGADTLGHGWRGAGDGVGDEEVGQGPLMDLKGLVGGSSLAGLSSYIIQDAGFNLAIPNKMRSNLVQPRANAGDVIIRKLGSGNFTQGANDLPVWTGIAG